MRRHFSIEWMAQSSQPAGPESSSVSGPAACGTHSESLPGFYCKLRPESLPGQEQQESRRQHLGAFSQKPLQHSKKPLQLQTSPSKKLLQLQTSPSKKEMEVGSCTEEETSGYESEGGRSLSPSNRGSDCTSTSPPSPPAGRRPRTAFTVEQISSLEKTFKRNAYLGTQDKVELCKKLNLSDKQIRNWFQNRRMKLKRTVQDALAHACQANVASQFMHYTELQACRPSPYPRYPSAAPETPVPASYIHPYSSPLPSTSSLPLDSFYQYSSLPGVMLPAATSHLMGSYPAYPPYY